MCFVLYLTLGSKVSRSDLAAPLLSLEPVKVPSEGYIPGSHGTTSMPDSNLIHAATWNVDFKIQSGINGKVDLKLTDGNEGYTMRSDSRDGRLSVSRRRTRCVP